MITLNLNNTNYKVENYASAVDIIDDYCEEYNVVVIDTFPSSTGVDFLIMRDKPCDAYFEWARVS